MLWTLIIVTPSSHTNWSSRNMLVYSVIFVLTCPAVITGLSIAEDIAEHLEDNASYIHFESRENNKNNLWKRLELLLQKPKQVWTTPGTLSSHPSSCEQLTYCERNDGPEDGIYRRLPIYPWWYYSCQGTKVKCQPCPTTGDLDQPTLFFSERCQQCISEYKDEKIACPKQEASSEVTSGWRSLFR